MLEPAALTIVLDHPTPFTPVPTLPHTSHLAVSGTAPSLPVRMFLTVLALPFSMLMAPMSMLLEMLSR